MFDFQGQAGDNVHKNKAKTHVNFIYVFSHIRISIIYIHKIATLIAKNEETIIISYYPIVKEAEEMKEDRYKPTFLKLRKGN